MVKSSTWNLWITVAWQIQIILGVHDLLAVLRWWWKRRHALITYIPHPTWTKFSQTYRTNTNDPKSLNPEKIPHFSLYACISSHIRYTDRVEVIRSECIKSRHMFADTSKRSNVCWGTYRIGQFAFVFSFNIFVFLVNSESGKLPEWNRRDGDDKLVARFHSVRYERGQGWIN